MHNQATSFEPGVAPRHCTAGTAPSLALTSVSASIFVESALGLALIPMLVQTGDGEQGHSF